MEGEGLRDRTLSRRSLLLRSTRHGLWIQRNEWPGEVVVGGEPLEWERELSNEATGGDVDEAGRQLKVAPLGLRRRLRVLGIS